MEEIKAVAHMMGAEVIIFDNTLSPMQLRNLKDIIERPVFDRTHLILQIFSSRARTREAQIRWRQRDFSMNCQDLPVWEKS